jgi:hypothetical protein
MDSGQLPETPAVVKQSPRRSIKRMLYSQNPFYLLSVCFVLHGTGIWYRANAHTHSPWILTGIIGAYIVMMAGVGFAIVKWGQVWDDTRSILLILLALFLELGMTADDVIIGDRSTGRAMALVAWMISVAVAEFILIGLRIRLKVLYRIPFHLFLGLILLYPIAIVHGDYPHNAQQNNWTILLFPVIAAGIILSLIPAVRRGASYVKINGTPWLWPLYPWSLFSFLIAIVLFRSYALCLSFDPVLDVSWHAALQLQNCFGGIYLAPIVLAVSVLCLEGHLSTGSEPVRRVGLLLPFSAMYLAWPGRSDGVLYSEVLEQVTLQVASPIWLTVSLSVFLFACAMVRRIRNSEIALSTSLVLLAFLGPADTEFRGFTDPSSWHLILAAGIQVWAGWKRQSSVKVFAGILCGVVMARSVIPADEKFLQDVMSWYLTLAAILFVGLGMNDSFSQFLRHVAAWLLIVTCLAAPMSTEVGPLKLDALQTALHMIGTSVASLLLAWRTRLVQFQTAAVLNTGATTLAGAIRLVQILIRLPGGKGILWAIGGLTWFAMAALISARKARATVSPQAASSDSAQTAEFDN